MIKKLLGPSGTPAQSSKKPTLFKIKVLVVTLFLFAFIASIMLVGYFYTLTSNIEVEIAKKGTTSSSQTILASLLLTIILIFVIVQTWNKNGREFSKTISSPVGIAFLSVLALNALIALALPSFWSIYFGNIKMFLLTNAGIILMAYLFSRGSKGEKIAGWIICVVVIAGWFDPVKINCKEKTGEPTKRYFEMLSLEELTKQLPQDTVLKAIAECESGGKQFEEDGVTPLKNKGIPKKGIKPTSAFGKYQFLEIHREKAKEVLGPDPDLNREEDQDAYAKWLLAKEGTKHWEHDEKYGGGKACWGPKLIAASRQAGLLPTETRIVLAPVGKPSEEIEVENWGEYSWGRVKSGNEPYRFHFRSPKGKSSIDLPTKDGKYAEIPDLVSSVSFESLGDKPLLIRLTLGKQLR